MKLNLGCRVYGVMRSEKRAGHTLQVMDGPNGDRSRETENTHVQNAGDKIMIYFIVGFIVVVIFAYWFITIGIKGLIKRGSIYMKRTDDAENSQYNCHIMLGAESTVKTPTKYLFRISEHKTSYIMYHRTDDVVFYEPYWLAFPHECVEFCNENEKKEFESTHESPSKWWERNLRKANHD